MVVNDRELRAVIRLMNTRKRSYRWLGMVWHFWLECMGDVGVPAQRGSQLAATNQLLWLFYIPASHVWFIFCVEQCCTLQTVMWDTPTHTYTHQHPYTETSNYWYIASLYVAMYMCVLCLWMVSHASNYSLVQQKHFSFGQTRCYPCMQRLQSSWFSVQSTPGVACVFCTPTYWLPTCSGLVALTLAWSLMPDPLSHSERGYCMQTRSYKCHLQSHHLVEECV